MNIIIKPMNQIQIHMPAMNIVIVNRIHVHTCIIYQITLTVEQTSILQ